MVDKKERMSKPNKYLIVLCGILSLALLALVGSRMFSKAMPENVQVIEFSNTFMDVTGDGQDDYIVYYYVEVIVNGEDLEGNFPTGEK